MTDVQTKFTSDDKEVNRALQNMQKEMAKLREEAAKGNAETKEHHNELRKTFHEATHAIKGMVPEFYTVGGAIEGITENARKWGEQMDEVTAKSKHSTQQILRDLAQIGQARMADSVAEQLSQIPDATRDQATQIWQASMRAMPGIPNASDRALEITRSLGPGSAFIDSELAATLAGGAAAAFPGKADPANFAIRAMIEAGGSAQMLPDVIGRVQQLASAGLSPEQAMAMAVEDLRQNQSPKVLTAFAESIDKDVKKIKPPMVHRPGHPAQPGELSPTDLAVNRFAEADRAERVRLLQADALTRRGILGDSAAIAYEQFDRNRVLATEESLRMPNGVGELVESARSTQVGAGVYANQVASIKGERADENLVRRNVPYSVLAEEAQRQFKEGGIYSHPIQGAPFRWLASGVMGAAYSGLQAWDFARGTNLAAQRTAGWLLGPEGVAAVTNRMARPFTEAEKASGAKLDANTRAMQELTVELKRRNDPAALRTPSGAHGE